MIRALRTEGLFSSTSLAYRGYRFGDASDCLVTAFLTPAERERVQREFVPVRTYPIYVPPSYCANRRRLVQAESPEEIEEQLATAGCPLTVELYTPIPAE